MSGGPLSSKGSKQKQLGSHQGQLGIINGQKVNDMDGPLMYCSVPSWFDFSELAQKNILCTPGEEGMVSFIFL